MKQLDVSLYIMTDGSRTVAETLITAGSTVVTANGSSGREPGDKYDAQTGEDLAVARALHSLASRLERRARGRVSHAESCKAHKAEIAARTSEAPADVRNTALVLNAPLHSFSFDKLFSRVDGPE